MYRYILSNDPSASFAMIILVTARHYIVMELRGNLTKDFRGEALARFFDASFKCLGAWMLDEGQTPWCFGRTITNQFQHGMKTNILLNYHFRGGILLPIRSILSYFMHDTNNFELDWLGESKEAGFRSDGKP